MLQSLASSGTANTQTVKYNDVLGTLCTTGSSDWLVVVTWCWINQSSFSWSRDVQVKCVVFEGCIMCMLAALHWEVQKNSKLWWCVFVYGVTVGCLWCSDINWNGDTVYIFGLTKRVLFYRLVSLLPSYCLNWSAISVPIHSTDMWQVLQ